MKHPLHVAIASPQAVSLLGQGSLSDSRRHRLAVLQVRTRSWGALGRRLAGLGPAAPVPACAGGCSTGAERRRAPPHLQAGAARLKSQLHLGPAAAWAKPFAWADLDQGPATQRPYPNHA